MSFVGASAPIVTGTTFIFVREPVLTGASVQGGPVADSAGDVGAGSGSGLCGQARAGLC